MVAFNNPVISGETLVVSGVQSVNYTEAHTGFRLGSDGSAEFTDVAVNGTIGAANIDAGVLSQGGMSLDSIEAPFAHGLRGWKFNTTAAIQTWAAAGEKIMESTMVLEPGRVYLVCVSGIALGGTVNNDTHGLFCTWTASANEFTAPASPTTASTLVTSGWQRYLSDGSFSNYSSILGWISNLGAVNIQATVAVCIKRMGGTGQPQTAMTDAFGGRLFVIDGGLNILDSGNLFVPGGGGGGSAPTPHDVTWLTTSIQTYRQSGAQRTDTNGHTYAFQGAYPGTIWGDQTGLFFFDSAAIRSALAGATIQSTYVFVSNVHTYLSGGVVCHMGSHNADPTPGTIPGISADRFVFPIAQGADLWSGDVGPALGQEFRDGTTRGLIVGPASTNINDYSYFDFAAIRVVYTK